MEGIQGKIADYGDIIPVVTCNLVLDLWIEEIDLAIHIFLHLLMHAIVLIVRSESPSWEKN